MKTENWHSISAQKAIELLKSDPEKGLSEKEAKIRQEKLGTNKLPEEKPLSSLFIFLEQFKSPLVYILVIAGIVTFILKEYTDSMVIMLAVFLNTLIGFFQEYKASKTLIKLKKVVKYKALIIREGKKKIIDSENLVPGDIFLLKAGGKVPADGRIIEARDLRINEMALTGEWLPTKKQTGILPENTSVADRENMVYMGTIVENGNAKIVCTETGLSTQIGKVALMVKEIKEEKTPLQKKMAHFSKVIGIIIAVLCLLIFFEGILTGNKVLEMFEMAVAVAVAAIPEGLPVSLTIILALGMQKILEKKGLVRKLLAAETLGSTSIICTDKTGTLTEGKMKVSEIFVPKEIFLNQKDEKAELLALKISVLANEAFIENPEAERDQWVLRGTPTSKALLSAAIEAQIFKHELEKKMKKISEFPFESINKYLAALYQQKEKFFLFVSGAPERILALSSHFEMDNQKQKLDCSTLEKLNLKLESLAKQGLRVVAAAYQELEPSDYSKMEDSKERNTQFPFEIRKEKIKNLVFVGLIALNDPLRKGVKEAVKKCRQAGVRPIIVTGDHSLTAKAIAQEIGLKTEKENLIEGRDLDSLSEEEFSKKFKEIEVYARVEPRHKMRIVEHWQRAGEVVAMTGDGINDTPALKKADIGVALSSGTDVAKEVSDLILLTNSFDVIVKAIEEGRAILDNMRKVITFLLAGSFSEIILVGVSLMSGLPLPIFPVQILWTNLIEDGLPNIALAFEPEEKDLMKRKPEKLKTALLNQEMKAIIFIIGLITDFILVGLFIFLWFKTKDLKYVRTMIFVCLGIDSLFYVFSCKSLRKNIWHINPFSNKFLIIAVLLSFLALTAGVYLEPLQKLLKTIPLALNDWIIILGLGMIKITLIEITKWFFVVKGKV